MVFPSYRNKSDIDPSQALIDPQIDGVSLGIHQPPSWGSCYWEQVLSPLLWVKAIRLLRPSDNRLSLTDRPSCSIHQTLAVKLKQPPKVSRITASHWSHPDNPRAFPEMVLDTRNAMIIEQNKVATTCSPVIEWTNVHSAFTSLTWIQEVPYVYTLTFLFAGAY